MAAKNQADVAGNRLSAFRVNSTPLACVEDLTVGSARVGGGGLCDFGGNLGSRSGSGCGNRRFLDDLGSSALGRFGRPSRGANAGASNTARTTTRTATRRIASALATAATVTAAIASTLTLALAVKLARRGFRRSERLAFTDRVGQSLQEKLDRSHAVVVAGDRQVDEVGVAIRIEQSDNLDSELPRLGDRDMAKNHC